jgi:hypothetical protein
MGIGHERGIEGRGFLRPFGKPQAGDELCNAVLLCAAQIIFKPLGLIDSRDNCLHPGYPV